MTEEELHNRAEFKKGDSHQEKIEKHNKNVKETMKKAEEGETINLSDLMIDREELHIEEVEGKND